MMLEKVEQYINDHRLLVPGDKIIVAVSGGPDSTALLLALKKLATRYDWKLIVAHVNYHTRGADSERDEKFVRQLVDNCSSLRPDAPTLVVKNAHIDCRHGNFEEQARDIRYKFFESLAERSRANKIAVAHTADDQIETMIQNMLRGSGLRGASGMPVKRGAIVRPLLSVSRPEILRWLRRQKQSYRTDRSNRDLKYNRNWIRWRLLPYLRRRDKSFGARLQTAGKTFDRAAGFLEKQSERQLRRLKISEKDGVIRYQLAPFLALPEILQGEMIRELLGRKDIGQRHVQEVLSVLHGARSGKRKEFKGRVIIKRRGEFVFRENRSDNQSPIKNGK